MTGRPHKKSDFILYSGKQLLRKTSFLGYVAGCPRKECCSSETATLVSNCERVQKSLRVRKAARGRSTNTCELTVCAWLVMKQGFRGEGKEQGGAYGSFKSSELIATEHAGYIIKHIKCQFVRHRLNAALPGAGPAKFSCPHLKNL